MQHPHQAFSDLSIAVRPIAGAIGGPDCQWHYGVGGRFARQATAVIAGTIPVIERALTGGLLYFGLRASLAIRPTPSTTCLTGDTGGYDEREVEALAFKLASEALGGPL
jgi:hypothetical protein